MHLRDMDFFRSFISGHFIESIDIHTAKGLLGTHILPTLTSDQRTLSTLTPFYYALSTHPILTRTPFQS